MTGIRGPARLSSLLFYIDSNVITVWLGLAKIRGLEARDDG